MRKRDTIPGSTAVIEQLSQFSDRKLWAMNHEQLLGFMKDMKQLLVTKFEETEIKDETKSVFAAWRVRSSVQEAMNRSLSSRFPFPTMKESLRDAVYRYPHKFSFIEIYIMFLFENSGSGHDTLKEDVRNFLSCFRQNEELRIAEDSDALGDLGGYLRTVLMYAIANHWGKVDPKCRGDLSGIVFDGISKWYSDTPTWHEKAAMYWMLAVTNMKRDFGGVDPLRWKDLEYGPEHTPSEDRETPLQNEAFIAIPPSWDWNAPELENGRKNPCTLLTIPKILPAEVEVSFLTDHRYRFKDGNKLYLFQSGVVGNWAVLICSDFLNLPIHVLLQGEVHTLFVISYNQDVNAYHSIADTIQRLSMCNVVICNIGNYGSSQAFSPYRTDYKRNKLKVVGNDIDVAVTVQLPLRKLAQAQNRESLTDARGQQLFVKRPPDFGKFHVIKERRS